jgi:hypothetical protein
VQLERGRERYHDIAAVALRPCLIEPAGTFYLQSGIDEVLSGTPEFILRTVPSMSKYVDPFGLSKAFIPHLSQ